MALFGQRRNRRRLRALRGGTEGVATIVASDAVGEPGRRFGGDTIFDLELNVFGTRAYWLTLLVRLPGREPYEVRDRFDVPRKAENVGFFDIANKLQPGVELPVRVAAGDPATVAVDWDRFLDDPSRPSSVREARVRAQRAQVAEQIARNPKLQAKMWAGNRQAVRAWADAVRMGSMTREAFERSVTQEVESGRMAPADAEAGRRALE
jgi:hypothetical protein